MRFPFLQRLHQAWRRLTFTPPASRKVRVPLEVQRLEDRCVPAGGINIFSAGFTGRPGGVNATPDGKFLFISEQEDNKTALFDLTTHQVTEFNMPPGTRPHNRHNGPDGLIWFTGLGASGSAGQGSINSFDPVTHTFHQYTRDGNPADGGISLGVAPHDLMFDANFLTTHDIYFTEQHGGRIGKLHIPDFNNPAVYQISEILLQPANVSPTTTKPHGIMLDTDGNIMFTEEASSQVVKFNLALFPKPTDATNGTYIPAALSVKYQLPAGSAPHEIFRAPNNNLYITELDGNRMDEIVAATGQINQFQILPPGYDASLVAETLGPDNNSVWFTEFSADRIGKLDLTTHQVTNYRINIPAGSRPLVITTTPDGNLWFGSPFAGTITQVIPSQADQFADPANGVITQMYNDLFHRDVDQTQLAALAPALRSGAISRYQVAAVLVKSHENEQNVVAGLYQKLLHRQADPGGLDFWTSFLTGGASSTQLQAILIGSPEYFTQRGGGTVNGFLAAVYQDLLGRAIDPSGQQMWSAVLAGGTSTQSVAQTILGGLEFDTNVVQSLWRQTLTDGRLIGTPAPVSLFNAVQLLQQGVSVEAIQIGLLGSDEYFLTKTVGPSPVIPGLPTADQLDV